jgi:APA family basic amino acid/polyamine antiporter
VWLMINLTALTWVRFAVWLVVGTAIYVGYGRRHSVQGRRDAAEQACSAAHPDLDANSAVT